jgi:adenylate cyclase class IV
MHNVEFKARLQDPVRARAICDAVGAAPAGTLDQTDTYFHVAAGRLKRREIPGQPPQWILYRRDDAAGPRISEYEFLSDADAGALLVDRRPWLAVRKRRDLFMHGSVRIHLDAVEGLGAFIEFEAPVTAERSAAAAHEEVARLRLSFAPVLGEPIAVGYVDLLAGSDARGP